MEVNGLEEKLKKTTLDDKESRGELNGIQMAVSRKTRDETPMRVRI
jgi:hypothetical protein